MILTIDELKKQIQMYDESYTSEDAYLTEILDVAESAVENELQRTFSDVQDNYGYIPKPIRHAILLLAAHLYSSREAVTFGVACNKVKLSYEYLLSPYMLYN